MKSTAKYRMLNLIAYIKAFGLGFNLDRLGKIYRTDKAGRP